MKELNQFSIQQNYFKKKNVLNHCDGYCSTRRDKHENEEEGAQRKTEQK